MALLEPNMALIRAVVQHGWVAQPSTISSRPMTLWWKATYDLLSAIFLEFVQLFMFLSILN